MFTTTTRAYLCMFEHPPLYYLKVFRILFLLMIKQNMKNLPFRHTPVLIETFTVDRCFLALLIDADNMGLL